MAFLSEQEEIRDEFYFHFGKIEYSEIFGIPTIFYKLQQKIVSAKALRCPRCGNNGVLMHKRTVSNGKYRYRKLYVYHETYDVTGRFLFTKRFQKWCYLNRNQLEDPIIKNTLKSMKRARDIERCFYMCLKGSSGAI